MAQFHLISPSEWTSLCTALAGRCEQKAMTALHYTFLFSQAIDDALTHLPQEFVERARLTAEQFGYENLDERDGLVRWVSVDRRARHDSTFGQLG